MLNLSVVEMRDGRDPEYAAQPFFKSRILNSAILLKHRVRADERYVFDGPATSATKIILPFESTDLGLGARSMFVGQRGWRELLKELLEDSRDFSRDVRLLTVLGDLPSLDPFLLREQLKRHGFQVARCYFAISDGDYQRMHLFVSEEITKLIKLAYQGMGGAKADAAKLVEILLSTKVDERLEPLRATLSLEGEAYKEGVFSWKGFLYYKWVLSDLWPKVLTVFDELKRIKVGGSRDPETMRYIQGAIYRLQQVIRQHRREIVEALEIYDDAFRQLTDNGKPAAFREFLVKAPAMFMMLGERVGGISHIASFWRFRFPDRDALNISISELADLLQDFEASLAVSFDAAA